MRDREGDRARLRRHQPRGHRGAPLLRDRGRLRAELDIPVFHDDQHGTAVVVLAALMNALKIVGKQIEDVRVVVVGVGAAGVASRRSLLAAGVQDVVGCDRGGRI